MTQTIAIVDYAMSNIFSVKKALEYIAPNDIIIVTRQKERLRSADRIIFPGQGAMHACMDVLVKNNLTKTIIECAKQKPFLGICLGLQLLFEHSEENRGTRGLGMLAGKVLKFRKNIVQKIPHMGWNNVTQKKAHPLWHNIEDNTRFYSVHSYFVKPKYEQLTCATTHYGMEITCAVSKDKVFAVQFHPEKSQKDGLQLLKNFTRWYPD